MSRARLTLGLVCLIGGIVVATVPGISVWRAGGQMLNQLPAIQGVESVDQRVGWTALFDDDFVLARRTYIGADERAVSDAMGDAGFSGVGLLSKDCCGDYDAVKAKIDEADEGSALVVLTPVDDDWRRIWPAWVLAGLTSTIVGLVLLLRGRALSAPGLWAVPRRATPVPSRVGRRWPASPRGAG